MAWGTFLKCNANKTDVILMGSRHQTAKVHLSHGEETVAPSNCVGTLALVIDSRMTMAARVASICRSARYQWRNIGKIRQYLTADACERLVRAVTCRLDINNALLQYGLSQRQVLHTTPVLMNLHWLPVNFLIESKILLQVYHAINNLTYHPRASPIS